MNIKVRHRASAAPPFPHYQQAAADDVKSWRIKEQPTDDDRSKAARDANTKSSFISIFSRMQ